MKNNRDIPSMVAFVAVVVVCVFAWTAFLGWAIVSVISWFGPELAVWQGAVIAVLFSIMVGSFKR